MKYEEMQIDHRLNAIEHQLHFFKEAYLQLHNTIIKGTHYKVEDGAFREIYKDINNIVKQLENVCLALKSDSILGTLAYIGKRINEIGVDIYDMKNNGIKKKIHLDLTLDGYEMVKKKNEPETNIEIPSEDCVRELLHTLTALEQRVLIHRFGLFLESKKTLEATGIILKKSRERVRQIEAKALRKCRHPSRKTLVDRITHKELKMHIRNEDE